MNNGIKKLTLPSIQNDKNDLFDEVALSLTFYYDPYES